jgi:rhodanese-related sulfurtransferase
MPAQQVSNEDLQELINTRPDLQVVDVRTPQEIQETGAIAGALCLPVQEIEVWANTLDLQRPMAFVCRGGVRSLYACDYMEAVLKVDPTLTPLYNLEYGMSQWDGERVFLA